MTEQTPDPKIKITQEMKKRPVGRPPKMVVKIDDTPENVAKAMFGIKSDKPAAPTAPPSD